MNDYLEGMKVFKKEILNNKDHYLSLQEQQGLYIRIKLWKEGEKIKIDVSNNVQITAIEERRMMNKIKMGKQYHALEDALNEAIDDMEGSGLGLIILVLMLKKMGIRNEKIKIDKTEEETSIGVEIPVKGKITKVLSISDTAQNSLDQSKQK
jgi:hypothetical protein